ncbi:MAG: cobalamin-dependent protein [Candidatus Cloacimonetes bacterium]|nr:cobalamin-dependent protein [Candidatus Cloacimonadota bacterium]
MIKTNIKIALLDVRHSTKGLHSRHMPLAIGLIASYSKKIHQNVNLDFRLYISANKFLSDFRYFKPDIVGGSFYCWNKNLNFKLLELVKERLPNTITVFGGPELGKNKDEQEALLIRHPYIDICVFGDGEKPFAEIVKHYINGRNIREVDSIKGTFYLKNDDKTFSFNPPFKKVNSLDEIPSPYVYGLFDQFFDQDLHPMIQTTRGCPFTCAFCTMSHKMYKKISRFSLERVIDDIEYCGRKLKGRHEIQLFIADSNFGMFPNDLKVATAIKSIQEEMDWPRYLNLSMGKENKENVIKTSSLLRWNIPVTLSAQSFNHKTLDVIERKNCSLGNLSDILKYLKKRKIHNYIELIYNLPEETKETFEKGIKTAMDLNIGQIIIMTLVLLRGTPISQPSIAKKYGYDVKYRIIPRQFGEYGGKRVVEIEKIVVSTNTLTKENYKYFRVLQLIIVVSYNTDMYFPVRKCLMEKNISIFDWVKKIHTLCRKISGRAKEHIKMFEKEADDELFDSEESIKVFIQDNRNYKRMLNGEYGDNLMNKYQTLSYSDGFDDWLKLSIIAASELIKEHFEESQYNEEILKDIQRFIKKVYDFSPYYNTPPIAGKKENIKFGFDIKRWLVDNSLRITDCLHETEYELWFSHDNIKKINQIIESKHDNSLKRQFVYRDYAYHAFIPAIERVN